MKRSFLICSMLIWCGLAAGRTVRVYAGDPNWVESDLAMPEWADPNEIVGDILSWTPYDPNAFVMPTGKAQRNGLWNDPDGHDVSISAETEGWTATVFTEGRWTLTGEIALGENYIIVRVVDTPGPEFDEPKERFYTICIFGEPEINTGPMLAGLSTIELLLVLLLANFACLAIVKLYHERRYHR